MKFRYLIFIALFVYLLEGTFLQHIRVMGVMPNVALITVVVFALAYGEKEGYFLAVSMGMLQDISYSQAIGVNTLILGLVVWLISLLQTAVFEDNHLTSAVITCFATVLFHLTFYVLSFAADTRLDFALAPKIIMVEALYNAVLCFFVFKLVHGNISNRPSV